ncbi:MAG: extracellular repeat protein, family [Candidatus Angelobacter sp.]|nr:extracellular repeat protein, family [Candidatus Angelobacter sp.]
MPLCGKARFSALVFCSILNLGLALSAQDGSSTGKCGFQSQTIPSPAGTTTTPTDLNDNGAIVGFLGSGSGATFHITGFLFSGGKFTHFRFPGSADTFPRDINKNGVIVGSFDVTGGRGQRAFRVQSGTFSEVKIPGFPNAPAVAQGINDLGDIVGQFNRNGSDVGFLLHQGKLTVISFPGATSGTFPTSINNQGVIVGTYLVAEQRSGSQGFMWKNGAFTNIQFPGAAATFPTKINDHGDIVGTYVDSSQFEHGFAFENGRFSTIDTPGSQGTQIVALNNFDNVLGFFATAKENVLFKGFCSSVF